MGARLQKSLHVRVHRDWLFFLAILIGRIAYVWGKGRSGLGQAGTEVSRYVKGVGVVSDDAPDVNEHVAA